MTKQATIYDCVTGETITRDFTAAELADMNADKIASDQADTDKATRATARQALLDKLRITADEAQLLLG